MKFALSTMLWVLSLLAVTTSCGCAGFSGGEDGGNAADSIAKYWDGPKIGPGMAVVIDIGSATGKPTTMNVLVDQKGEVTLSYLLNESIKCDGLTLDELRVKVVAAYSKYIRQPQVSVTFGPYDGRGVSPWGTVTVMGEVMVQGPVNMPPTMDLTVTKALQLAGGIKPFADRSGIVVTRCDKSGKRTRTKVDLKEIGAEGRSEKDIVLRAGDVVYVPETWY